MYSIPPLYCLSLTSTILSVFDLRYIVCPWLPLYCLSLTSAILSVFDLCYIVCLWPPLYCLSLTSAILFVFDLRYIVCLWPPRYCLSLTSTILFVFDLRYIVCPWSPLYCLSLTSAILSVFDLRYIVCLWPPLYSLSLTSAILFVFDLRYIVCLWPPLYCLSLTSAILSVFDRQELFHGVCNEPATSLLLGPLCQLVDPHFLDRLIYPCCDTLYRCPTPHNFGLSRLKRMYELGNTRNVVWCRFTVCVKQKNFIKIKQIENRILKTWSCRALERAKIGAKHTHSRKVFWALEKR